MNSNLHETPSPTARAGVGHSAGVALPAKAATDTNALFGAFEFSTAAAKAGIQPILGTVLDVELPDMNGLAFSVGRRAQGDNHSC